MGAGGRKRVGRYPEDPDPRVFGLPPHPSRLRDETKPQTPPRVGYRTGRETRKRRTTANRVKRERTPTSFGLIFLVAVRYPNSHTP